MKFSGRDPVSKMNQQYGRNLGHGRLSTPRGYSAHIEIALLESLTLHNLRELLDRFDRIGNMPRNPLMTAGEIEPFMDNPVHPAVYLPDEKKIPSETPRRQGEGLR
jgi:hypothetical protein